MEEDTIVTRIAGYDDEKFAGIISIETETSAQLRGSGISKRSPASIVQKMREGKAVIAVTNRGEWAGFSYIEIWGNGEFVSNSGLIVSPPFRSCGVAAAIKKKIFSLGREKYPAAKIFSITTGLAIMKLNARLGFETVTFNEITNDKQFWDGCQSCVNHDILVAKCYKNCLCTAMRYTP